MAASSAVKALLFFLLDIDSRSLIGPPPVGFYKLGDATTILTPGELEALRQQNLEKEKRERDCTAALFQDFNAANEQQKQLSKKLKVLKGLIKDPLLENKEDERKKYLVAHKECLENVDRFIEIIKKLKNKKQLRKPESEEWILGLLKEKIISCAEILRFSIDNLKKYLIDSCPQSYKSNEYRQDLERLLSHAKEQLPLAENIRETLAQLKHLGIEESALQVASLGGMLTIQELQRLRLHGITGLFLFRSFSVSKIHTKENDVALLSGKLYDTMITYSNLMVEPSTSNQIQISALDNILMQCEAAQADYEFIKNDFPDNNDCLEQSIDIIKLLMVDVERDLRTLLLQEKDLATLAKKSEPIDFDFIPSQNVPNAQPSPTKKMIKTKQGRILIGYVAPRAATDTGEIGEERVVIMNQDSPGGGEFISTGPDRIVG